MKTLRFRLVLLVLAGGVCAAAQAQRASDEPLTIRSQGSFFVGGEKKALPAPPPGAALRRRRDHRQPDVRAVSDPAARRSARAGRHGARLLLEQQDVGDDAGRPHGLGRVLRAEGSQRLSRGPGVARALRLRCDRHRRGQETAAQPPSALPNIIAASHQVAWTVFRFGPSYGTAFPDGQFPIEAARRALQADDPGS